MVKPLSTPLFATAGVTALALALAGCASGSSSTATGSATSGGTSAVSTNSGGTIAFSTVSTQIPLITSLGDDVTSYLKPKGISVIVENANDDPAQQAQQLAQAINTGQVKAAWIFPVAPATLLSTVKLAQSKHVPLVIEAGPSDLGLSGPQPGIIFDSSSFADYGTAIGKDASACVNAHGGKAQVLFMEAPETAGGDKQVSESISAAFAADSPDATIVATGQAADLQTAETTVSQLLIAHPGITAVIGSTDETALGAVDAFKAAGKKAACVIDGGGSPDSVAAEKAGEISAIVSWNYAASVAKSGADLLRLLSDPTVDGGVYSTPISDSK
jgi:ABC-type sugar transport system substrate-binding protein